MMAGDPPVNGSGGGARDDGATDAREALRKALAGARARYLTRLPDHIAELCAAMDSWRASGSDADRQRVLHLSHRLSGTAGSYGFQQLSAIAGRIEDHASGPGARADAEAATLIAQLLAEAQDPTSS